jgi:hypothetical protein
LIAKIENVKLPTKQQLIAKLDTACQAFGWKKENMGKFKSDEIGPWSEIKLEIIEKYAAAYTKILSGQQRVIFKYEYIDGFCGAGEHISKSLSENSNHLIFNLNSVGLRGREFEQI